MATVNITDRFLNQQKRESEALTVTIPAVLQAGGGRSQAQPVYIQGGDALTASIIEPNTIIKHAYLVVDEAFPSGALINVDIAGTQYFTGVDGTATGLTVSTTENGWLANKQTVTVSVTGVSGDVVTGKARVILDTVHPLITNGNYAAN